MSERPLEGLCVLVTRPADRANPFAHTLAAEGGRAILFPAIEIRPRDKQEILDELAPLAKSSAPLFIFVSVYAASHGLQSVTEIFGQPGILVTAAVGEATAQRLAAAGCRNVILPLGGSGSEALLRALEASPMAGRQVIILRGPPGREKLARELKQRGANVAQISVYERRSPEGDGQAVSSALAGGHVDVVTVSSVEVFENLDAALDDGGRKRLRNAALLVPSERVVRMVRERGAQGPVILADGADDHAMLEALRKWRRACDGNGHNEEQDMSETREPQASEQDAGTGNTPAESEAQASAPPHAPAASQAGPAEETARPQAVAKEKKAGRGLAALALLLAMLATAGSGFLWWQWQNQGNSLGAELSDARARVDSDMRALRNELASRDDQFSDLLSDQQGLQLKISDIDALNLRVQGMESELQTMRGVSSSARRNWVMAEASYFLQAANASLQLNRNVSAALSALEAADDRLASLADPSLLPVRSVIASERQALSSLPEMDTTGVALTLGNLAADAGKLPTKTDNPRVYATPGQPTDAEADSSSIDRAKRVLGDAVKSLVTVRRTEQQASALLAPEEEFFLARNLELQLLTARLALLNEQPEIFGQSIVTSLEWLKAYFDPEAPEVINAVRTLQEIAGTPVQRTLPDISRSLTLLRAAQAESSVR